jgi:hypothetical protein
MRHFYCSIAKDCMANFFICLSLSIYSIFCHSCSYLIKVIDCIKAVDGEVRVPGVDSLKRHVLKRFQKVNSFESSILKDLSEKPEAKKKDIIMNLEWMINETFLLFNRERLYGKLFYLFITVHLQSL